MLNFLKDNIKKSKLFWCYRHILTPNFWEKQLDYKNQKRRFFYSKFIKDNKVKPTVFEFGCGSGINFHIIEKNIKNCNCIGYDISQNALTIAKQFQKDNWKFVSKIDIDLLLQFLNKTKFTTFGLAIYDRVLYNLSNNNVENHFNIYGKIFDYIIIDDFVHFHNKPFKSGGYISKNYFKILSNLNFKLIHNYKSKHNIIKNDQIFDSSARILIFKNIFK